jgi:hypothetical protein
MLRITIFLAILAMGLCAHVPLAAAAPGSAKVKQLAVEAGHGNARSLETLEKQAVAGDVSAQKAMGDLYKHGRGVPRDDAKAASWYRKASELGLASAQAELGFFYYHGRGVPQSYPKAVAWWRKAVKQGDASAQANLGVLYYKGEGVAQDYAEAAKLWRGAAEQGDAPSQYNIGYAYYQGQGVPRNFVEAYKWLGLAALYGRGELRDAAVAARDGLAQQMTPAQLVNAQQLLKAWRPKL